MQSIDIELKPSKLLIIFIFIVLLGSIMAILSLSLSIGYKSLLMLGTFIYGLQVLWNTGLMKGAYAITRFQLLPDGSSRLLSEEIPVKIKGDSVATRLVCVLRFIIPGKRQARSCIIFKDAVSQETYRQLLVWLRCCARSSLPLEFK